MSTNLETCHAKLDLASNAEHLRRSTSFCWMPAFAGMTNFESGERLMPTLLLTLLLLVPVTSLAGECGEKAVPATPSAEWLVCSSDVDCVTFKSYCEWHTANKTNQEKMGRYLQKKYCLDRIEYECSPVAKNTPQTIAKCIAQQCVLPPEVTH